ncbi:MAG: hypothetical protein R3E33_03315 [Rhodocyclaceae bacterium]
MVALYWRLMVGLPLLVRSPGRRMGSFADTGIDCRAVRALDAVLRAGLLC